MQTLFKFFSIVLFVQCAWLTQSCAQKAPHLNIDKKGIAIQGYDVVSYYSGATPEKGLESLRHSYKDAIYLFANNKNKEAFVADPERYVPQYGGWCAYAMGISGDKVKIDPKTFKLIDDQLYLFYNFRATNTLESWNEDEKTLKADADKYWAALNKP